MSEYQPYESYRPRPEAEPPQVYVSPQERSRGAELEAGKYKYVEHVDSDFPETQNNLALRHKLELDAEDTVVVVGDKVDYHGGPLTYQEIPGLKVDGTHRAFGHKDLVSVKAILEGKRVVVYATDHEKAMLYINQMKKIETA